MGIANWFKVQGTEKGGVLLDKLGDKNGIIDIATNTVNGADEHHLKNLIEGVLKAINRTITCISEDLILATVKNLTIAIINATLNTIGGLPVINKAVVGNDINKPTLSFIWKDGVELAKFLVGLLEPAKQYALANSTTGHALPGEEHGAHNEMDLTDPMNRHGVISQVQRLSRSIIFILREMTRNVRIDDIEITANTSLLSDDATPRTISEEPIAPANDPKKLNESWIFVNGIATECYWLRLACRKLAQKYSRVVTGVHNRSDGILWDLVECAGERSTEGAERSASQRSLILPGNCSRGGTKKGGKVVVIAHSQGCLLLRLALEDLLVGRTSPLPTPPSAADEQKCHQIRETMLDKMYVFTFGNPSVDWKIHSIAGDRIFVQPGDNNLSDYFSRTEHFANDKDFVAKLGVLSPERPPDSGYSNIFVNFERTWIGHLFASQYSLDPAHYRDEQHNLNGHTSKLLTCAPGNPIL